MDKENEFLEKYKNLLRQLRGEASKLENYRDQALIILDQKNKAIEWQRGRDAISAIQEIGRLMSDCGELSSDYIISRSDELLNTIGLDGYACISPATPMYNTTDIILNISEDTPNDIMSRIILLITGIKSNLPVSEKGNQYFMVRSPVEYYDDYMLVEFNQKNNMWLLKAEKDGQSIIYEKSLYKLMSGLKEHIRDITSPNMLP